VGEYQNRNYGGRQVPQVDTAANLSMIRQALERAKPDMLRVIPPKTVSPESLIEQAMAACTASDKLAKVAPEKVAAAVLNCAQIGLSLDPLFGQAYLEPRWNRDARAYNCRLGIGYRGHIALILRAGQVTSIVARVIYEHDTHDIDVGSDKVIHKPLLSGDPGRRIAAYARADFPSGHQVYELMREHDLNQVREMANSKGDSKGGGKGRQNGPWYTWPDEMDKKSCVNRLRKWLLPSVEMQMAARWDAETHDDETGAAAEPDLPAGTPEEPQTERQAPAPDNSPQPSKPAAANGALRQNARDFARRLSPDQLTAACQQIGITGLRDLAGADDHTFKRFNDACRKLLQDGDCA
jgi:recombination protein RecT